MVNLTSGHGVLHFQKNSIVKGSLIIYLFFLRFFKRESLL